MLSHSFKVSAKWGTIIHFHRHLVLWEICWIRAMYECKISLTRFCMIKRNVRCWKLKSFLNYSLLWFQKWCLQSLKESLLNLGEIPSAMYTFNISVTSVFMFYLELKICVLKFRLWFKYQEKLLFCTNLCEEFA